MIVLETERLSLSLQTEADAAFVLELMNTESWLKFIGDRGIKTIDDARIYIVNGAIKSYAQNGFGFYLVRLKENVACIGICGLVKRTALMHVDIGFAFMPQYEGRGYGLESSSVILEYAKNILKLECICAITIKDNQSSISLLTKLGMVFNKTINMTGDSEELMLFEKNL